MQRFLIIQTAFIGDVILCTPVVSELKRVYPNALIDVVVRKGNETLLANHPGINKVIIWDKNTEKYRSLSRVIKMVRSSTYSEIINLQRFHSAGLICMFGRAKAKIGFSKNKFPFIYSKRVDHKIGDGTHEVERNLKTILHHEGVKELVRPSIFPSNQDFSKVKETTRNDSLYFCMAPASVWETKRLPSDKWVELIKEKCRVGKVYLIGGPQDHKLCEDIKLKVSEGNVENTCGQFTLLQSAALMKGAQMNFVNDSGPLHLASAVNAPTTAFFCSTVPRFGFGPLSDVRSVVEIDFKLDCRPCGLHGYNKCPESHFKCGNGIEIKNATD